MCLFKCNEKYEAGLDNCKSNCFKKVIVPYRYNNHAAKENEENLYRMCLAQRLPNLQHKDYIECTQNLYKDRIEVLYKYMASVAEGVLQDLH